MTDHPNNRGFMRKKRAGKMGFISRYGEFIVPLLINRAAVDYRSKCQSNAIRASAFSFLFQINAINVVLSTMKY